MKVMVMIKATKNSEAGMMPSEKLLTEMGAYNEALMTAGVLLSGEGLLPSRRGQRLRVENGQKTVSEGPFADTHSLVAGFWLWQVKSMSEAMDWVKRCPEPMPGEAAEFEIRQVATAEDFGEAFTPELRENEERLAAELDARKKAL